MPDADKPALPNPAGLAACRDVLLALCDQLDRPPPNLDGVEDVLRLADRLVKAAKARRRREERARDLDLRDQAGVRAPASASQRPMAPPGADTLARPRDCYVCKQPYQRLHPFYDMLCRACGDLNFARRRHTADLAGRFAVVTGGRVKIGYQVALKLLRAGARVAVTTRFPRDAARRYAAESDVASWSDRLSIHALDLRHLPAATGFAGTLRDAFPRLDVLVQNAAQTVRRPPAFYRHLLDGERADGDLPAWACRMIAPAAEPAPAALVPGAPRLPWSALLSQAVVVPGDGEAKPHEFPAGQLDADGQQVDCRAVNSWGLELAEVEPAELVEAHAVNCLAPFLLLQALEPLLRAGPDRDRYVVMVSGAEGQFDVSKNGRHPHTCMAKSALNMIVRCCAGRYAEGRIFLNSVDPGWVSNEAARPKADRMREEGFRPPLDHVDGASRVLDPVFTGVNSGVNVHSMFLKDYRPAPW